MTEVLAVCQGARWPRGRGISIHHRFGRARRNDSDVGLLETWICRHPPPPTERRPKAESVIGRITGDGNPFDAWATAINAVNVPHAMSVVDKRPPDRFSGLLRRHQQ